MKEFSHFINIKIEKDNEIYEYKDCDIKKIRQFQKTKEKRWVHVCWWDDKAKKIDNIMKKLHLNNHEMKITDDVINKKYGGAVA